MLVRETPEACTFLDFGAHLDVAQRNDSAYTSGMLRLQSDVKLLRHNNCTTAAPPEAALTPKGQSYVLLP